jgi:hypothetical protein
MRVPPVTRTHFTQNTVCTLRTDTGRTTVHGLALVRTVDGERREETIDPDELGGVLAAEFGIQLPTDALDRLRASPPEPVGKEPLAQEETSGARDPRIAGGQVSTRRDSGFRGFGGVPPMARPAIVIVDDATDGLHAVRTTRQ